MSGRSVAVLTVTNGAGAMVGLATSAVTAHLFGTTRALEVFFAASTVLALITRLTQVGQLAELYLPTYHRVRHEQGLAAAQGSFAVIVNWMLLGVIAIGIVLWLVTPVVMHLLVPGFESADRALGASMFRWLLPLVFYEVVIALLQMMSNAERWFGRPEAANVFGSAVTLVFLLALAGRVGIWAMVASLWIGRTAQLLTYLLIARRMGYRHRLQLRQEGFRAGEVFRGLTFTLGYVGATQVYIFALNAGLSLLPQGTYAVFSYVQQLYAKTQTVLLRPVSVVFFTYASQAVARGASNTRALARTALGRSLMIWSVIMAMVIASGRPALAALWGVARFGAENLTIAVRLLVVFYALLFISNIGEIARKTAMSLGEAHRVYGYCMVAQLLSAGSVALLLPRLGYAGAAGVVAVNVCALALAQVVVLGRRDRALVTGYPLGALWRWGAAVLVAVAMIFLLVRVPYYVAASTHRWREVLWALGLGGVTATVTVAVAWVLKVPEVRMGTRMLWRMAGAGAR